MKPKSSWIVSAPLSLFLIASAHAADNTWNNAVANLAWDNANANWAGPATWTNGDSAIFGATGIGAISVASGVTAEKITFNNTGYSLTGGPLTLTGPEISTAASTDTTISSVIQGAAGLTKKGAGILRLAGTNTYTGTTLLSEGSLLASNASGNSLSGNITLGNNTAAVVLTTTASNQFASGTNLTFSNAARDAKLQLRGTTQTVSSINSTASNTLSIIQNDESGTAGYGAGGGTGTLIVNNNAASTFDGIIRNGGGAAPGVLNLTKTGTGTLTILNTTTIAANGYTGTTTVSDGLLQFGNSTASRKAIGSGPLQINTTGSVLIWNSIAQTHTNTISGSGALAFRSNNSDASRGGNEHIITGTSNSGYSGAITVTDSRLRLQNASSPLGNASATNTVTMAGNGQLMYNAAGTYNYNVSIGGLGYYETAGQQLGALRLELGAVQAGTVTLTGNAGIGTQDAGAGGAISGVIGQSGGSYGFTKLGTNTLTLTAANTYTGATVVRTGTLALSGSGGIAASTTIEVASGAFLNVSAASGGWTLGSSQTLKGTGTVTGDFTVAGSIAPGTTDAGTLTAAGTITLGGTSSWQVQLGGTTAGQFDKLIASGNINAAGAIALSYFGGYTPGLNDQFDIADFAGFTDSGYTFDTSAAPLAGGYSWDFSNFETTGVITVVPEVSTSLLAGLGVIGLLRRRRM
ncbi:autotransporter-associated beta strand repeat-containing protein [Luteolibacter yonseiensis]|uniref:Autotransporter-associated beta strand repeat-containing protein n=1 Tax=Luteolibacter yonseiensis TaxID=1144680 RepID=A0A934V7F9_9BACT|nr:autotransporter-associated beta strand repeat-containing protein [Luteolibacter yonseiensis]MBK1816097.1 autotransporter-associated beta strand repeat-containing protein [Luteolibacter yonseiensis]